MIDAKAWFDAAIERGVDFFAGVPCSFLTPFINYAISNDRTEYIGAASEGETVGIAAGAWLGGRKTMVMCQNSGFGNMVNPLTSLNHTFRIPTMLVTTWRGQPGLKDEPQHGLMGARLEHLLDALELPHELFPSEEADIAASLDRAMEAMASTRLPYAFVMQKGTVAKCPLNPPVIDRGVFPAERVDAREMPATPEMSRQQAVVLATEVLGPDRAYLATTGKLGRELFTVADRANHFYHVGAMGCVSGVGLGLALTQPKKNVVVLDGDGSLLMKMGALATIGHYAPRNFLHIVFDNERHESTGGQLTVSSTVEFAQIAAGAGYRKAYRVGTRSDFEDVLGTAADEEGPALIHVKVGLATDPNLGRPTVTPHDVAVRFRDWIEGGHE